MTSAPRATTGSLSSGIAVIVALVLAIVMLLVFGTLYEQAGRREAESIEATLGARLSSAETLIRHDLARMRSEVRFLADLPAVAGIGRAIADDGYDATGHSSRQLWLDRLAEIFRAYAESEPTVRQVRLIGIADRGRELLRVERRGTVVERVADAQLQAKSDRPYVSRTIAMAPGATYVTGIELNREHGQLDEPHWATVRVATPATGHGHAVYGVVVINFDARRLLAELASADNDWAVMYLANANGDFLVHPDPAKRFGFDLGTRHRIADEFPDLRHERLRHSMQLTRGSEGSRYVAMQALVLDPTTLDGGLTLLAVVDPRRVSEQARSQIGQLVPPMLLVAAVIMALAFAMLRRQLSPLHALVAAARDVAATGDYSPLPRGYGGEVGELVTAFDAMHESLRSRRDDSRQLEFQLRESEAFANAIVRSSPSGILVVGDDGLIVRSNLAAERMFGYAGEEMQGHSVDMLVPIEQRESHPALRSRFDVAAPARPMGERRGRLQGQRKDGSRFPAEIALANLLIRGDRFVIATVNDVTEQRQRQMHSDMLASIVEHSSDFIFICTPLLECLHLNPAACRVVGLDGEVTASHHLSHFLSESERARLRDEITPSVEQAGRWSGEVQMQHGGDGPAFETHWEMFAIRESDGQTKALAVVAMALADQRARAAAEAASDAKSSFLAHMSHEMRTPLNAVLSVAHLLSRTTLDPAQRRLLAQLERAARHLTDLISDVLDLSKIEAGKLIITTYPFALGDLLQEITGLMALQAAEHDIAVGLDLDPELPPTVVGDATRINQIIGNLMSNAIKFTEHGRVDLGARLIESHDGGVLIEFSVTDTGIGIAPQDVQRLFAPFTQIDPTATRRSGGTGLGLAIVHRLATAMGGEIGVSSELGKGSRFWCRLCLRAVAATAEARSPAQPARLPPGAGGSPTPTRPAVPQLAGIRVLVVDDSDINRDLARQVLQLEGARVRLAASGEEALALLHRHGREIDVVLMDLQMPGLDGFETTSQIRQQAGLQDLPVIALTAAALPAERERAAASGMRDFLTKPIEPQMVIAVIRRQMGQPAPQPAADTPSHRSDPAQEWPTIEGIVGEETRVRLGGDVALLRALLGRLFDEFGDLLQPPDGTAVTAAISAARMHKLKGIAANLGATRVRDRAAAIERALDPEARGDVDGIVAQLSRPMTALREASADFLAAHAPSAAGAEPLDAAAVGALITLLRRHDLAAGDAFERLSGTLAVSLGATEFERLRHCVDRLEFDAAASILSALALPAHPLTVD